MFPALRPLALLALPLFAACTDIYVLPAETRQEDSGIERNADAAAEHDAADADQSDARAPVRDASSDASRDDAATSDDAGSQDGEDTESPGDGEGSTGSEDGDGSQSPPGFCTGADGTARLMPTQAHLLYVLDRSGSMQIAGTDRWRPAKQAVIAASKRLHARVASGLLLFPGGIAADCSHLPLLEQPLCLIGNPTADNPCQVGSLAVPIALEQGAAIGDALENVTPRGGTPTAASLEVARRAQSSCRAVTRGASVHRADHRW